MNDEIVPPNNAPRARRAIATSRFVPQSKLDRQGFTKGDFWLGRTLSGRPFGWHEDLNLLTCAGTRAGKGVGVIVPNLLLFPGSAVVIDPKGELATLTAKYRQEELGQKVIVLDPVGVADVPDNMRGSYNPLAQLDENDPGVVSAAQSIASGIVVPNPHAKDPFWDQTALSFIQAVILYMVHFYPPEKRTLMKLRETASVGDWQLYQDFLQQMREGDDGDPDYQGDPEKAFDLLLSEMFECDAFSGILREEAAKIKQMGDSTRGNVLGGIRTHLDFLKEPLLWSALEDNPTTPNTFSLADLRNQDTPTTVYICLPVDMMYLQGRWMRLIVMQIFQYIQRTPFDKSKDRPVLMMIDEFFQLGPIPSIENTLTYASGFGLRLWLIIQDIKQLQTNYPQSWETILGACGIQQFFGINDMVSAKYLSEILGEEEVDVPSLTMTKNTSQTEGRNSSHTYGTSQSDTSGESWSRTVKSWNFLPESETTGGSSSTTTGSSTSDTSGTNNSQTQGDNYGFTVNKQARKLYKPDEILLAFSKANLTQLTYVRDQGGMLLYRTPYYVDPFFAKLLPEVKDEPETTS